MIIGKYKIITVRTSEVQFHSIDNFKSEISIWNEILLLWRPECWPWLYQLSPLISFRKIFKRSKSVKSYPILGYIKNWTKSKVSHSFNPSLILLTSSGYMYKWSKSVLRESYKSAFRKIRLVALKRMKITKVFKEDSRSLYFEVFLFAESLSLHILDILDTSLTYVTVFDKKRKTDVSHY